MDEITTKISEGINDVIAIFEQLKKVKDSLESRLDEKVLALEHKQKVDRLMIYGLIISNFVFLVVLLITLYA
jgi:hypothetical protein